MILLHKGEPKEYHIRQAWGKPFKDVDYITKSWLKTYWYSPEIKQFGMTERDYWHYQHRILDQIIPRCSSRGSVYVCHEKGDANEFRGFLVAEAFDPVDLDGEMIEMPPVIHWVQVKKEHKKQGVMTALITQFIDDFALPDRALIYTHSADNLNNRKYLQVFARNRGVRLIYNPWMKTTLNAPGWER